MRKRVRVGVMDYKISVEKEPRSDGVRVDGSHSWSKSLIRVRKMSAQAMKQTLWHEIVHSLCIQHGIPMKEPDVDRIATGITQVIRDNPWIAVTRDQHTTARHGRKKKTK